jgi:hypothetical protein
VRGATHEAVHGSGGAADLDLVRVRLETRPCCLGWEEEVIDHVCLVAPVREAKAAAARAFMHDLDGARRDDYDRSEQRIGMTKDVWFLAATLAGELLVGYMESGDFNNALTQFVGSRDEFDLWFKERFADVTGLDLNNPPEMQLPELLSAYEVGVPVPAGG